MSECPVCGAEAWDCEYVDVGPCNVPSTPYGCYVCQSFLDDDGKIVRGKYAPPVEVTRG